MATTQDLLKVLEDFDKKPESQGYRLRLDLSAIVLRHLSEKGWTQQQLADAAGVKPPYVTRIIHGATNCTFESAGNVLFALGVKVKLVEAQPPSSNRHLIGKTMNLTNSLTLHQHGSTDGKEKIKRQSTTSGGNATIFSHTAASPQVNIA